MDGYQSASCHSLSAWRIPFTVSRLIKSVTCITQKSQQCLDSNIQSENKLFFMLFRSPPFLFISSGLCLPSFLLSRCLPVLAASYRPVASTAKPTAHQVAILLSLAGSYCTRNDEITGHTRRLRLRRRQRP